MAETEEKKEDPNYDLRIATKISDETGIKVEMVQHILWSIIKERPEGVQVNTANATKFVILELINNDNGPVKSILLHNGINSSKDIGTVVRMYCEEGRILQEEGDDFDKFDGLFETENIDDFIKLHKLRKETDWYHSVSYTMYVVGVVIVVATYVSAIPNAFGFVGWGIGMLGWALIRYKKKIFK